MQTKYLLGKIAFTSYEIKTNDTHTLSNFRSMFSHKYKFLLTLKHFDSSPSKANQLLRENQTLTYSTKHSIQLHVEHRHQIIPNFQSQTKSWCLSGFHYITLHSTLLQVKTLHQSESFIINSFQKTDNQLNYQFISTRETHSQKLHIEQKEPSA